jgi:hypothetical protein
MTKLTVLLATVTLFLSGAGTAATHGDCNATPDCTVGWTLNGSPIRATFLHQVEHDHPVFLVNRPYIPQPGPFSHFHWLGSMPAPGALAAQGPMRHRWRTLAARFGSTRADRHLPPGWPQ